MSDPQRPEREAIEQALRETISDYPMTFPNPERALELVLAALPPTPRLPCYCCSESGCSDGCMCSRACSVCQGEDVPCAKCKGSGRELVAREAPADAPPATPTPGWQDISTAPKDGTRFLFTNGQIVGTGLYLMGTAFAADSWQGAHNTTPTHWMPLPPVPSEGDAK